MCYSIPGGVKRKNGMQFVKLEHCGKNQSISQRSMQYFVAIQFSVIDIECSAVVVQAGKSSHTQTLFYGFLICCSLGYRFHLV